MIGLLVAPGLYEENIEVYVRVELIIGLAGPDSTFISGSGQNRILEINYGNWLIGWIDIFGW